jgi:hypothetical protein
LNTGLRSAILSLYTADGNLQYDLNTGASIMTAGDQSIFILLLTLVAGCAMQNTLSPVHLKGFVFRNHTSGMISDVEVRVPKTKEVAGCTSIPPEAGCSNNFPLRKYQGNPLTLSWSSGGKIFIKDFVVRRPEKIVPGKPATAILTFTDNGSFSAELVQGWDGKSHMP